MADYWLIDHENILILGRAAIDLAHQEHTETFDIRFGLFGIADLGAATVPPGSYNGDRAARPGGSEA